MLSLFFGPLVILFMLQGHLRSRLIICSLQGLANGGMLLVSIPCRYHGPDIFFVNGRTQSFDRTLIDIAQMGVACTSFVKSVDFNFVQHVHVGRCECGLWTDYKVLPGVTGHRRLRTGQPVLSLPFTDNSEGQCPDRCRITQRKIERLRQRL